MSCCPCGEVRDLADPPVLVGPMFKVVGIPSRRSKHRDSFGQREFLPPQLRACRVCGSLYVPALVVGPSGELAQ